jgi:hypothetical protein
VGESSDYERYRALLKDADDEQKRLTLFHLLFAEGAKDRIASETKPSEPEPLVPQALQTTSQPPLDETASTLSPERQNNLDNVGALHPQAPSEPDPSQAAVDGQVLADPSPPDDLVDMIADLLSARPSQPKTAYTMAQSFLAPVTDDVNSIASQIQAALAKLNRPPSQVFEPHVGRSPPPGSGQPFVAIKGNNRRR